MFIRDAEKIQEVNAKFQMVQDSIYQNGEVKPTVATVARQGCVQILLREFPGISEITPEIPVNL